MVESQRLGRAAVFAVLRVAQGCPAAVIDSTWFPTGLVDELGGPFVEIRCDVDIDVAGERYKSRWRDARHLDTERTEAELWGDPVPPLGVGPLIRVDTNGAGDVAAVASLVLTDLLPR